jgi:hypothetical protein
MLAPEAWRTTCPSVSATVMKAYTCPDFDVDGGVHEIIQHREESPGGEMNRTIDPEPIVIDPHYSPQFYAELFGTSPSTILRWFQDMEGVLKLSKAATNGRRTRVELRIGCGAHPGGHDRHHRAALCQVESMARIWHRRKNWRVSVEL